MRVVVADDVMLTRQGIVDVLGRAGIEVVGEATNANELLSEVRRAEPDAAVVDIRMPPTHTDEGIVAAEAIRAEHPRVAVLILSHYLEPSYAINLIENHPGSIGYLIKERVFDPAILVDALRRVCDEQTVIDPTIVAQLLARQRRDNPLDRLSPREREVLSLVAEGMSNRAIANRIFVTDRTVEAHIKRIFEKLGLVEDRDQHRRVRAVLAFLQQ